jgi:TPR repeat protein
MRHACEQGVIDSCTNLGQALEGGSRVTADPVEAAALYRRACDGDGGVGCGKLGKLYYYGTGVQKDHVRSAELFQKSCDLGAAYGCYSFGYQLARGEGIDTDIKRGLKLMQGACDDNGLADSCGVLASFYEGGIVVPRDPAHAARLYKQACDAGLASACR